MEEHIIFDSIGSYNACYGFETMHPLVAVADLKQSSRRPEAAETTYHYGIYALFLKQTYCGDITYGRTPYDYQDGTVTSFAPGQTVRVSRKPEQKPDALGLLFHPDLIRGTSLAKEMKQYSFFAYSSHEALHLSEEEKTIFKGCVEKIKAEAGRPADRHSRTLICKNIELLLDYCLRFYDRQFDMRREANSDILGRFETELDEYFSGRGKLPEGLPSVEYFAGKCFLSPNYFGDLIKKETGRTPRDYIQNKIIGLAKDELAGSERTVGEISDRLGFQYPQHFNRYFKRIVGMTPSEYRRTGSWRTAL